MALFRPYRSQQKCPQARVSGEFLARNHITWMLQQKRKHLERLVLQLQADAVLVQLTRTQVTSKAPKRVLRFRAVASIASFRASKEFITN